MSQYTIQEMKEKHKILAEFKYELKPVDRGYNRRSLYVNVGYF